jgi:hypothetical protein
MLMSMKYSPPFLLVILSAYAQGLSLAPRQLVTSRHAHPTIDCVRSSPRNGACATSLFATSISADATYNNVGTVGDSDSLNINYGPGENRVPFTSGDDTSMYKYVREALFSGTTPLMICQ